MTKMCSFFYLYFVLDFTMIVISWIA